MITYEVTATVEAERMVAYESYMKSRHIPDLLATGCFVAASFSRDGGNRYRMRYEASSRAELERYLRDHAGALRAHVVEVFPSGVALDREEWTVLGQWPTQP